MEIIHCSFCKHGNPLDAKFCNACGASLELQLCEACGAIDKVSATACHKCAQPFTPRLPVTVVDEDETQGAGPQVQVPSPTRRWRSMWKVLALLALIVVGTLVLYPRPTARDVPAGQALSSRPPAAADAKPVSPAEGIADTAPPAAMDAAMSAQRRSTAGSPELREHSLPDALDTADDASSASPSPTDPAMPFALADAPAPETVDQHSPAPAANATEAATATPPAKPSECSPAVDALGLCNQGLR